MRPRKVGTVRGENCARPGRTVGPTGAGVENRLPTRRNMPDGTDHYSRHQRMLAVAVRG